MTLEQQRERERAQADRRAWVQMGLALVGAAAVLGSVAGAGYGWVRSAACWCCNPEDEEPYQ